VRHYDSIVITGETFAIVGKQIVPAASGKPSAMHVDHNRAFA
jgi:hypothetical protein